MPIIDYLCPSCGHTDSHYAKVRYAASKKSETSRCSACGHRSHRDYMVGAPGIGFTSKSQKSIVVHLNPITGEYSIPGQRDDPVDKGYKKVEITSMAQYNKFCKGLENVEKEKADFLREANNAYFDDVAKEHRQSTKERMERAIARGGHEVEYEDENGHIKKRWAPITPRARLLFDLACRFSDQSREKRRQKLASGAPNIHNRLLEYRESERSIVDGEAKRAEFFRKK